MRIEKKTVFRVKELNSCPNLKLIFKIYCIFDLT